MIRDFLGFEIRKNLDLRKFLVTPKIFLRSRFHCKRIFIIKKRQDNFLTNLAIPAKVGGVAVACGGGTVSVLQCKMN